MKTGISLFAFAFAATVLFPACRDDDPAEWETEVTDLFESGSMGEAVQTGKTSWDFFLADDNNNPDLPDSWRCWWFVKMDRAPVNLTHTITLKNSGWPYFYVPVFSGDGVAWEHFPEDEVNQDISGDLTLQAEFSQPSVWMARIYPYTFTDLEHYLETLRGNPFVDLQSVGASQEGRPVYLLKITDPSVPVGEKKRVFLHARTHPAETSPSFLLEGLIAFVLSDSDEAREMRAGIEFYIFPMQNVDGVVAGNYRSTPRSENLEVLWCFQADNPLALSGDVPVEVALVHEKARALMTDGGPPVSLALNLHASNSEPDIRTFFFPHFGPASRGYNLAESSLWEKQVRFIRLFAGHAGEGRVEPLPEEGGSSFAAKTYPESWWWANFHDEVMAMTLELTYGRAGYAPRWIEPDDYREQGKCLALTIRDYYTDSSIPVATGLKSGRASRLAHLKFPERYPPDDPGEMKE
ncbi:MAG TPA: M14-type cytosolic carboxypeptidase [Prolixibacteraceae bacterium]|nr:M14-type cytosolic carboxypeptidase [Prolixibacteraceae bacterium]